MNEANQEKERKSRLEDRAEMEQKAKASAKRHSRRGSSGRHSGNSRSPRRSGGARSSRSPGPDIKNPRSSRSSSRQHSTSGASKSRHRSRSRDSLGEDEVAPESSNKSSSGRNGRLRNRAEEEQAIKAAAKRSRRSNTEEDVLDTSTKSHQTSLSLADSDAALKKKLASRNRSRSTEPMDSLKKPSRRHSSDDKAALKDARSRRTDPVKPGVERVRHRRRSSSRGDDKLSASERSSNIRKLHVENNYKGEVHLHATTVDEPDEAEIQVDQQRIDDVEQRLDEVIERNKQGEEAEPPAKAAGVSRLVAFLLFLFGVGIGVAVGFFLRGGCEPCKPCETDSPTSSPIPDATAAPTTTAPTINFVYDPPSDEDCLRIQNMLPINGQSELDVKKFDILVDTGLTNESLEASNWPEVVAEAMAAFLIPDLVGCSSDDASSEVQAQSVSNDSRVRRNLRNIRYVIANAIASGERHNYYSCEGGAPSPCYKAAVTLTLFLKGDEPNVSLFTLISNVILAFDRGAPLVDKFSLSKNTFAFVNIVGMEEVPYEPSSEEACDAIANGLAVPGQGSMVNKTFDVAFDVTRANSDGVTNWLPELTQGIEEHLVPELACCGDSESRNGRMLQELGNGRNLRCAVGNALATAREVPEVPCQPGRGANCVHVVLNLEVSLKGDEQDLDVANLITNVINGNTNGPSIVDRYDLSTNTFAEINLVIVESDNPTKAPTLFQTPSPSLGGMAETPSPTESPSSNPTVAPAVGPTTEPPTRAPTQSPTKAPTFNPTKLPTAQPVDEPTPPPTPGPTPGPTMQPSLATSQFPSSLPSFTTTAVPSAVPSLAPSEITREQLISSILSSKFDGTLEADTLGWMLNTDTWMPSEGEDSEILFAERYALAVLYSKTGGGGWKTSTNWLSNDSICSWYGVTCDGMNRVEVVDLGSNSLTGDVPSELSSLESLTKLDVRNNQGMAGPIPSFLPALTKLSDLQLGNSGRTGSIPAELWTLTNLNGLALWGNKLTGTIPPGASALTALTQFSIPYNDLSGTLPDEFLGMTQLQSFYVNENFLTGTIPALPPSITECCSRTQYCALPIAKNRGQLFSDTTNALGNCDLSANQCPNADYSEFGQNVKCPIDGSRIFKLVGSEANNVDECHNACSASLHCDKFTFGWDSNGDTNCYGCLRETTMEPATGFITYDMAPRGVNLLNIEAGQNMKCPFQDNTRLFKYRSGVSDANECFEICKRTIDCAKFSFGVVNEERQCLGCTSNAVMEPDDRFTPYEFRPNVNLWEDMSILSGYKCPYDDTRLFEENTVDAYECYGICKSTAGCSSFSWGHDVYNDEIKPCMGCTSEAIMAPEEGSSFYQI